jgi:hypothetical protein
MDNDWFGLLKLWLVFGPLIGLGLLELYILRRDRKREDVSRRTLEPMTRVDAGGWWNRPPPTGRAEGWWNRPPAAAASWERRRAAAPPPPRPK